MSENEAEGKEMSFVEHLEVLRWHIIRSVIAVVVVAVVAFIQKKLIIDHVLFGPTFNDFPTYHWLCKVAEIIDSSPLCINDLPDPYSETVFQSIKMSGQFTMHITISIIVGVICSFPYIFWEFWRFVKPALYSGEKRTARGVVFVVSMLFFTGILFGYYIVSPLTYNFFLNYEATELVKNQFAYSSYLTVMGNLVLVCGLMFQLPVAVYFLSKVGLVTPEGMIAKRKTAFIVILFVAAIFTPADVFSQLLVAFPLFFLYQISIFVSRIVNRRNESKLKRIEQ